MKRIGGSSQKDEMSEHILLYMTLFAVAAVIATSLLLFAAVLYIGELIGSLLLSLLIVGVVMALIAWGIYRGALRPLFRSITTQLQTIYEVASVAQLSYNWVVDKVDGVIRRVLTVR